jgi:hypothetical protein
MIQSTSLIDPPAAPPSPGLADYHQRQRAAEAALGKQLFFIASCSKSGSTWLQHILDGHPKVCCHGEAFFPVYLRPLLQQAIKQYNGMHKVRKANSERNRASRSGDLEADDVQHLYRTAVATIFARWAGEGDVAAIGDKTPENAMATGQLMQDFPGCKIIHLIRDGRDVCVSGWFHNLREKGDKFKAQFPTFAGYVPLMAGQRWKPYILAARSAGLLYPDRYMEVRYEQLHSEPETTIERLLGFLGVEADDQTIADCRQAGDFKRLSGGRSQGSEDRNSFFRKGAVGDWREHFDQPAINAFNQCAGDLARELGYV